MPPVAFLHLTDALDDTPVRIRMDTIEALYVHQEKTEVFAFHGVVATDEEASYTMIVYGTHGSAHGVRESIGEIESQMADVYELAGIAAL